MQTTEEILDLAISGNTDAVWKIIRGDATPTGVAGGYEYVENGDMAAFRGPDGVIFDINGATFSAVRAELNVQPRTTLGARETYRRLTGYLNHDKAA